MRVHIDPEKLRPQPEQPQYDPDFEELRGRPGFEPEDWQRRLAEQLSGMGVPHESIATLIGCSVNTMKRYLKPELDLGRAQAHAVAAGLLLNHITKGNWQALQFYMRVQMGWVEPKEAVADQPQDLAKLSDDDIFRELASIAERERAASQARSVATRVS